MKTALPARDGLFLEWGATNTDVWGANCAHYAIASEFSTVLSAAPAADKTACITISARNKLTVLFTEGSVELQRLSDAKQIEACHCRMTLRDDDRPQHHGFCRI